MFAADARLEIRSDPFPRLLPEISAFKHSFVTMAPPVANQPYFVPHEPGRSVSVRDAGDNAVDVEEIPPSVDPDDFAPKLLHFVVS